MWQYVFSFKNDWKESFYNLEPFFFRQESKLLMKNVKPEWRCLHSIVYPSHDSPVVSFNS